MLDSLMDALGYVGDALDKPGRAVRGVLGGRPEEALAALPFSDSLGLTDQANRVSGTDLLQRLGLDPGDGIGGKLAGMGVEALTDPTTYLGAGLGRLAGRAADAAQIARGPRYATGIDDLVSAAGNQATGAGPVADQIRLLFKNSPQAASEIPLGSSLLGAGAEGVAFRTPTGDVARAGLVPSHLPGRPIDPGILPTFRGADYGAGGRANLRIERMPFADGASTGLTERGLPRTATAAGEAESLAGDLSQRGIDFFDRNPGNTAMHGGRPVVIDPGAIDTLPSFAGGFQPVSKSAEPGPGLGFLLDALGGDQSLQRSLAAGRNSPGFANSLMGIGGLGGATAGRFGGR